MARWISTIKTWRQTYVGRLKFAQFDTVSTAKKIIVATEENVLAALNLKTGQVVWRHVLESASNSNIQLLHVSDRVLTVSGSNPYLIRGWETASGVLLWEWSLTLQNDKQSEFSEWWVHQGMLVHVLPVFGSHLEVTMYNMLNGQNKGHTSKMPAVWSNERCVFAAPYYTCVSGSQGNHLLLSLDVASNVVQFISKPLSSLIDLSDSKGVLSTFEGNSIVPGVIIDNQVLVIIKDNEFKVPNIGMANRDVSVTIADSPTGPTLLQTWYEDDKGYFLTAHDLATSKEILNIKSKEQQLSVPNPEFLSVMCTRTAREQYVCRILVTSDDDSVNLLQQEGRVLWTREEALTNVVAVEFVDLPVSDLEAAIESEFDQKEGSVWGVFIRRIQTQMAQLKAFVKGGPGEGSTDTLLRDYFNLHKIIFVVTEVGKVFGIDNLSGNILWQRYERHLDSSEALVFTRRSARHPPHDAYVTIVGRHEESGNGLLISLNPITGEPIGEKSLHLDYKLQQSALLHCSDPEYLRALILLDLEGNVQVLPMSSEPLVEDMYMYVAEKDAAAVRGYALRYDGQVSESAWPKRNHKSATVNAVQTWSMSLGGVGVRLVRALGKEPRERVHSPGRVLADRSVLYKYLNPNLVLFITEAPDYVHKDIVTVWLVDVVSGAVVWSQVHRRARASAHAVHTENMIAYAYYNDKHRRTEIASVELYTGRERWWWTRSSWEGAGGRAPRVERQAYVLPASLSAAAHTTTLRALTDRHVLLALSTGAIVELPWAYLEPRRGLAVGVGDAREEGVLPYTPELPLPAEAVINYNHTLGRVVALHTAPSGLESTCLVLATGLDLFYTRVAPSKTFDLLKDDFDYSLIVVVLAALVVATYSTKYFAARKTLKQAWNQHKQNVYTLAAGMLAVILKLCMSEQLVHDGVLRTFHANKAHLQEIADSHIHQGARSVKTTNTTSLDRPLSCNGQRATKTLLRQPQITTDRHACHRGRFEGQRKEIKVQTMQFLIRNRDYGN
ncbi:ER membrane protein complex subunit 1 [Eumeta japonica]|uniref:ER membrane protein complex subunit 1 n=1 Tax=Eumeta variegata TaxID=151549 RepID=A0A4C1ZSW8_EUMVA|nr:ER membrane protein complex subunit 1 [Eumeta japonica]